MFTNYQLCTVGLLLIFILSLSFAKSNGYLQIGGISKCKCENEKNIGPKGCIHRDCTGKMHIKK